MVPIIQFESSSDTEVETNQAPIIAKKFLKHLPPIQFQNTCIYDPNNVGELVMTIMSPKLYLLHILLPDSHLVVTRPQINLGDPRCNLQLVEKIINPKERVTILHCQLVQLTVIYAPTMRSTFFFTNIICAPQGKLLGQINCLPNSSLS